MSAVAIDAGMLDLICPMHLRLSGTGHVTHAGPTAAKLVDRPVAGQRFLELFELIHPRDVRAFADLMTHVGVPLRLRLRCPPATRLKGLLVPQACGGAIVNLSFGISLPDAVGQFGLNSADFALTDLAMEMLFLVEAKSAAMAASRKLNLRLQGAMVEAEEKAFTDTLTGLKNRRAVNHILPRLIAGGGGFSVMQLDLDFFKSVNDTRGHAAGDHVLREVAAILRAETRDSDCVARTGGDEFLLIFAELTDRRRLQDIADRIISRCRVPIPFEGTTCEISASIGIAISDVTDPLTEDRILGDSDLALYASKHAGRGQATLFDPAIHTDAVGV
ncbi:GGDEF domain-containing protein [Shimia biformata]|uniref:GGDEF domain-containing protein n=1 Tax=Shimia biformata TaxID=1294299 RepID=UPI00194F2F7E|nr:GGDEF domain-containing protein [Shimia biformata]